MGKTRNVNMDIIRCVALFTVVGIHFFLYLDFYTEPIKGLYMYFAVLIRTAFTVCVPLFMTLTGFLMCEKRLEPRYYSGIVKTLSIYFLASIVCILFRIFYLGEQIAPWDFVLEMLAFDSPMYGWYVEMYIGLFLLIPFLNTLYHALDRKQKLAFFATLIALTAIPDAINYFEHFLPSWWTGIYPLTYYFLGCLIKEYKPVLPVGKNILYFVAAVLLSGSFTFAVNFDSSAGIWLSWSSPFTLIMTALLFILLSNLNTEKMHSGAKKFLAKVSDLCFGAYLLSYIFDSAFAPYVEKLFPDVTDRLICLPVSVILVYILSLCLSFVLNMIYKGIRKCISLIPNITKS